MVQPPLAGRRASSVTGPSLQAIRERVGGSTIGRLTAPSPPQITVTTDGQQTTDIRLDQKGYLSGQESLPATSIDEDEDWARQLKDQDLPLQHVWSWTYTPPMSSHASSSADTYSSAFVALGELRTVQDWAKHVNHIPPPSSLAKGANYSLFRGGIEPVYEDVQHKQGGRWVLTLRGLSVEQSAAAIDRCWAEVMMALIGGMLPTEGEVACTGAVVGIRHRGDRLQLWTSTKASAAPIQYLGERLFLLLQQTLEGVRVIGGGYMLDFQSNFPTPGGNPRIRGWNSDTGPLLPRNAGWR